MRKIILLLVLIIALLPFNAIAAGSCTIDDYYDPASDVLTITWSWTSDASGDVDTVNTTALSGRILGVEFKCASATEPTDAYDVVLNNPNDLDMLFGVGANVNNYTNKTTATWYRMPQSVDSKDVYLYQEVVDPVVSNAGNAKSGEIILHLKVNP